MLALRTVRLQPRLLRTGLCCRLGSECEHSASHLDSIAHRLRFHLNGQQFRPYLFIPVSWSEARERLQRWLERTESRIVKVSLLNRRGRNRKWQPSNIQQTSGKSSNTSKKQDWYHGKHIKWQNLIRKIQRLPSNKRRSAPSLPLPSSSRSPIHTVEMAEIRNAYQRWKTKRKSQYQVWKNKREEQYKGWKTRHLAQYQGWKSRRQAQYQRWNVKENHESIKRRKVLVEEYSKSEWFDALGRPLTARDSTGRFVNPWQSQSTNGVHSLQTILRWRWQRFVRGKVNFVSKFTPPLVPSGEVESRTTSSPLLTHTVPPIPVPNKSNLQCTWIGHSTCLFQVGEIFSILTDPMFSNRASPFQNFLGVERDLPSAYSIQELIKHQTRKNLADDPERKIRGNDCKIGKLDLCCITHDHYDHMDKESVKSLKHHVQLWVVPLGISKWLVESCSIDQHRIVELQWWEQLQVVKKNDCIVVYRSNGDEDNTFVENNFHDDEVLTVTCCPSSHWAGRSPSDRNLRLWCSFAFSVTSFNFFFCGDSGYPKFPLFRQIGDMLGPFDLSCIPIGAYEPEEMNKDSHCNPREAVKIHRDIHSKHSVPIHWGSFQLTEESIGAPPHELKKAIHSEERSKRSNFKLGSFLHRVQYSPVKFSLLGHGETLILNDEDKSTPGSIKIRKLVSRSDEEQIT